MRETKNLSQSQVASLVFIDRSYYTYIESGKRTPSLTIAKRISEVLGFHYSQFEIDRRPFEFVLESSPISLAISDIHSRYTWVHNPPEGLDPISSLGKTDSELFRIEGVRELIDIKEGVLLEEFAINKVINIAFEGISISFNVLAKPLYIKNMEMVGISTILTKA
ncbi:helix-turn-helix transcriptional regulator [Bacillus tamaricis]|uniref:Helix-turn-helix transcriptional regulator n=1 Tax=Evansella tamaricis TaxID=2069301 RepID=A0ABS6JD94_9BACI|nr:helix-turn-helix transcriptional regulator [Evansella tamaricis]